MLNFLLWLPLAFGLIAAFLPKKAAAWTGVLGAVVTLGIAIGATIGFDPGEGMQAKRRGHAVISAEGKIEDIQLNISPDESVERAVKFLAG